MQKKTLLNYQSRKVLLSFVFLAVLVLVYGFIVNFPRIKSAVLGEKIVPKVNNISFNGYPPKLIPHVGFRGQWVEKENYVLFYDNSIMQARLTIHQLDGKFTRGNANRYGIRFSEPELIGSGTAGYSDFSGSGYDRGHLVPAGDFICCQDSLAETFSMSNIAPFDSVLNRHAWADLEIKVRSTARRFGKVYVFTGPIFRNNLRSIGGQNDVAVPTDFFKLLVLFNKNTYKPQSYIAFSLPNIPIYNFDLEKSRISLQELEKYTNIDFFPDLSETEVDALKILNFK
ncbi:DNA/RNA non-specific endonuclease [Lacihabitans sp. LS3-19]|uniref:DNA/RNA non-specific endonuclease n=1 Tax=Lacihabitans sp. LS3-19 TaxID=2487335 RepID=UPI0020CD1EF3|nr:DNA/RNA non-specific endonuclease [Lacihabitans sp. LS3-19]MCP9766798.1 DNA/RNA non-specific endonuclease [Lacihabitans sp. LS3-19]